MLTSLPAVQPPHSEAWLADLAAAAAVPGGRTWCEDSQPSTEGGKDRGCNYSSVTSCCPSCSVSACPASPVRLPALPVSDLTLSPHSTSHPQQIFLNIHNSSYLSLASPSSCSCSPPAPPAPCLGWGWTRSAGCCWPVVAGCVALHQSGSSWEKCRNLNSSQQPVLSSLSGSAVLFHITQSPSPGTTGLGAAYPAVSCHSMILSHCHTVTPSQLSRILKFSQIPQIINPQISGLFISSCPPDPRHLSWSEFCFLAETLKPLHSIQHSSWLALMRPEQPGSQPSQINYSNLCLVPSQLSSLASNSGHHASSLQSGRTQPAFYYQVRNLVSGS